MKNLIPDFIKTGAEPINDTAYGPGYRCSVFLRDGTFLPCVILRSKEPITALALRRFEEEKKGQGFFRSNSKAYENIVQHFVTSGNRLNSYEIAKIEPSRYSIPLSLLNQIQGETTMSWTGFVLEMPGSKYVAFGTTFSAEFFDIPNEYSFGDVVAVHNHSYVSPSGELKSLRQGFMDAPSDYDRSAVNRDKPYFECFYDA